jgi:glycosyltransferase involved in cell wall biosynthesis
MKIAIISSSFFPVIDGVTVAVLNRVKQLSGLGYRVKLFCPDYSVIENIYPDWRDYTGDILPGIEVINLPSSPSIGLDFERDFTGKCYRLIEQELAVFKPDLIHVDEAERIGICMLKLAGVKFARQHKIPCVAFFHTNYLEYLDDYFSLPWGLNWVIKKLLGLIFTKIYNAYDLTLLSSSVTYQKLQQMGIKNLRCDDLLGCDQYLNLVKTSIFWQKQYNLPALENKIKLIFLGRLTPDKGWSFALDAFKDLSPEILTQVAFIIVGDGNIKQDIERELKQLTSDVYLLGRIKPESVPLLLKNGDIFVTNSEKETRGLTVMEAAAAGIPAIAPRAGGVIDTIKDGETGFLYQPQDTKDFLHKLSLLISDAELRQSLGKQAQEVIKQYSWEQTVHNLVTIWFEQISDSRY